MFINIPQNTPEWLRWRENGLGGSDASAICGFWGEFRTLWEFKSAQYRGENPKGKETSEAMSWGHLHEDDARKLYTALTGIEMNPVCCQSDKLPFIKASLDGWNADLRLILEIKSPFNAARHRKVVRTGLIPEEYYPQVQHQLFASGASFCSFWSYNPLARKEKGVLVDVGRDEKYIQVMTEMESDFWRSVQREKPPEIDAEGCELLACLYEVNHARKSRRAS